MDIFRFIDSADIRRYLVEIQYRFSTEEKMFLIWYCKSATLNEKIAAWQEIVGYVPSCPWDYALDIRERVAAYIELQEKMLGQFQAADSCVYQYKLIDSLTGETDSGSVQGEVLADINIAALDAGEKSVLSYDIAENSLGSDPLQPNLYHLVVETDADEANYSNNEKDVYVHAKCAISLSSGNGGTVRGTGSYSYGSTVTISAIPNEGYMFEGWYENGRCLDNISDDYTFTAFTNRTIEAKFVPNDLTISNIEVIGDMEPETALVFSAKAEGGYQPYVWEYTIYKGDTLYYTLSGSTFDYLEWSPTETGNYTIVVCVIDKTGFKATYSKQFSII